MRLGGLNLLIKYVLVMVVVGTTSTSVRIPNLQRGIRVPRSLTLKGASPKEGRPKPKKGNGGDMKRPRKDCAKCGRAQSGECRQGTNSFFGCGESGNWLENA